MAGARARDTSPAKPISELSRHGMLLPSISGRSRLLANRLTEEGGLLGGAEGVVSEIRLVALPRLSTTRDQSDNDPQRIRPQCLIRGSNAAARIEEYRPQEPCGAVGSGRGLARPKATPNSTLAPLPEADVNRRGTPLNLQSTIM